MKICIIYSFKSELYSKNTFLKREKKLNSITKNKCSIGLLFIHKDNLYCTYFIFNTLVMTWRL